ncbi:MAG: deoxyribose-phosphate aldolase [Bacteroidota bacterium]
MNQLIDHTYLSPDCTGEDVDRICREALEHDFCAVCIPPFFVGRAKKNLQGSQIKVATVISYPYGYDETAIKVQAIRRALQEGADELDVVINLAAVRSGDWAYVLSDLSAVHTTVRLKSKVSKIIVEMSELDATERRKVCDICNEVKPTFVKTSTGTRGGATVEDVRFLREHLLPDIRIKASGGIRDRHSADALVAAGADRLGTSAGIAVATAPAS